ncbi:GPI mannosyltransferase 4 [Nannizzia gypsea CBS 118893]|uniref:Mannosyltransferase n=1 Tax=Arthroderma gypseum (strain ATCC MYA-4604 / CBS 118893) TaxID=535722 RepID=E4USB5_ARTGP|nr:GPI mannosyltransferase 4 [Nannizzia gypsea CBS 118893]EFR01319.1 GPI mannosyltransferase 4 [Nannizzia gypsea CBS 118893]
MWRRTYLLLLLVRVYLALCPSYIHPDENFQGPELFAGRLFSYPSHLTWEFTSSTPIRSIFPLWLVYGLPMTLLKWLWAETGNDRPNPPPQLVYHVLRLTMFLLSLILEDWAIHELVPNPRRRRQAVVLVASCYVTWTYQTHAFSNSLETLLVLWSLVLIQRIVENKHRSSVFTCALLALVAVMGVFNRITFPAFIMIPALQLVPHFINKPLSLISLAFFSLLFSFFAVAIDTTFYTLPDSFSTFIRNPTITPLNNLLYNSDTSNLASHGLHPRYNHLLVNLPLLLGPAYLVSLWSLFTRGMVSPTFHTRNTRAYSALFGALIISLFPHQEARFLLPCVPLLLTCFKPPKSRTFLAAWIVFNCTLGALMGIYHQGGVVPAQLHIPTLLSESLPPSEPTVNVSVLWWKTYSPPYWLVGDGSSTNAFSITTHDLKGMSRGDFLNRTISSVPRCTSDSNPFEFHHGLPKVRVEGGDMTLLVAPRSASYLDQFVVPDGGEDESAAGGPVREIRLHKLWQYDRHVNMDDFDPGDDGLWGAVERVFGRYGLVIWLVTRPCLA